MFAVDIGDEVLGALGEVEDGLKVDDFCACGLDGGVLAREHFQVTEFAGAVVFGGNLHEGASLLDF